MVWSSALSHSNIRQPVPKPGLHERFVPQLVGRHRVARHCAAISAFRRATYLDTAIWVLTRGTPELSFDEAVGR